MNLLLVDDEIAMLHIMEKAIDWKKKGIQKVFTAYNTDLARDIISSSKIDLVICDIEMPKENGLSLIQWIQDMYPEIINIILTGYPDFNYARSAISLGVYRYLLKPIAFDELEETIASAVEKLEEYKTKNKPEADPEIADAVNTIKKYLESHYSEVITRKKIEELVHLNQDHINREFKKQTGYTLMEYVQHYRILMAKKMLRETRVLCAARFGTARSVSDMGNFVNLEQVTDVLGAQFTFVNLHELIDQTHIGKSGDNYTLPGRAALNPTEEDVKEMEALADDLIGNAVECDMERKEVLSSERFYVTVKKMLDYYGCNAFAAPCPDACATRRLNQERMTFCLTHSLLGEMGIVLSVSRGET